MFAPVDPTGLSLLALLHYGSKAGHEGRAKIQSAIEHHHSAKASALTQQIMSKTDLTKELDSCIRRLSCSTTGVVVSSTMSFVLPHLLFSTALNGAGLFHEAKRLNGLVHEANQRGGVEKYISSTDITFQVLAGVIIKSAILICTLGTEVDFFIDGAAQLVTGVEFNIDPASIPDTWQKTDHALEVYQDMTGNGFLHETTYVAERPTDMVVGYLGYDHVPTWADGAPAGAVAEIGAASAVTDLATAKLVEDPAHGFLDKAAELWRKQRSELEMKTKKRK